LPASAQSNTPKELKTTTEEMFREWLDWKSIQTSNQHKVTPMVISQYESIIRLHIAPGIGKKPIRLITKKDLENFLFKELPAKKKIGKDADGSQVETGEELLGLSKRRAIQAVLNMGFRWAFEVKLILENPTIGVPKINKPVSPAVEEKLENYLWYPERLAEYLLGHPDEARWLIMMTCGLRASEKLGLEWDCFKHLTGSKLATVEIKQQLAVNPITKKLYLNRETKTRAGTRIIPLDKRMVQVMNDYRKLQESWKKSPDWSPPSGFENLVFTTSTGKPIRHQTDTKQWRALLERHKMPFIRQHAMRHIAISNLVRLGQPIEIIRSIAGHESEAITRATYTHLSASTKMEAMKKYSDQVFGAREKKALKK
jgi:integrase